MIVLFPLIALSLTVHEYWHARSAEMLGDLTGKYQGRCTLNPLAHLDPIGTLAMIFGPVGWARPVPVNPMNFANERRGMMISVAAGPLSNLCMAIIAGILLRILAMTGIAPDNHIASHADTPAFVDWLYAALGQFTLLNFSLFLFNLIPLYPLDGHHMFRELLDGESRRRFEDTQQFGMIGLLLLVMVGGRLLAKIIYEPAMRGLTFVAGRAAMERIGMSSIVMDPFLPW